MDSGAGGGGLGVVSSLAHSLDSGYPGCSHGDAYAVLTAPGIAFNRDFNLAGQARLASVMGVMNGDMDDRQGADAAATAVAETYRQLEMPSRLREVGVPEDGVRQIAVDSMTDFGITRNVRPVKDAVELDELLKQIW
jgi:alcohol dehydrogenase class IV